MFYIETPKCPRCDSVRTGRKVYTLNPNDEQYIINKSLKHGEFVKVSLGIKDSDSPNLFCLDCDAKWFGNTKIRWINKNEYEEIIKNKNINLKKIKKSCF